MPKTMSKTDGSNCFAFSAPDSFVALFVARSVIGFLFVIRGLQNLHNVVYESFYPIFAMYIEQKANKTALQSYFLFLIRQNKIAINSDF